MIAKEKSEAEESLAEALPALEEARLALDDLNKNDVTEIRSEPSTYQDSKHETYILRVTNCSCDFNVLGASYPGLLCNTKVF